MLNFNKDGLEIFSNFQTDRNLPKYKNDNVMNEITGITVNGDTTGWVIQPNSSSSGVEFNDDLNNGLFSWLRKWFSKKVVVIKESRLMDVTEFFHTVKSESLDIELLDERKNGYLVLLERAKSVGQVALVEKLTSNIGLIKYETDLLAAGFTKVVTEDMVVEFYKKCKKGLRLDWVKNFTRVIPCEVIDAKIRLDALKVFDNYVVLHYDPQANAYGMTQEEVRKKKDPILFGVIHGSNKLYFVGDWIDEVCDLTLEQLGVVVGQEKLDEASLKVNVYGNVMDIKC